MHESIEKLRSWINESDNIVFFGGAGVSTESGIPDFRGEKGLDKLDLPYPLETLFSRSFFDRHPEEFYKLEIQVPDTAAVKPNRTHYRLAELEREGKLRAVITQNTDGLHQKAGSVNVLELHGSSERAYCQKCRRAHPAEVTRQGVVPRCQCGGIVRLDVVLYGEPLDEDVIERSVEYIRNADVLIVGGSSLVVYPAAGFLDYYRGNRLVLVNLSATPFDSRADLVINEKISEVFSKI